MKAIIILILSFLLFSYSISAEEKNGAITKPDKNSEIKVLEERINGNENQIKTLKDELALKQRPMEKWYLFGAVILGAVIGFFLTEITERRRRKKDQIEKQKTLTDNIIADSLKYVLKANDIIGNIIRKKDQSLDSKEASAGVAAKLHSKLLKDYDEELERWYFPESVFHTYQLRRLNNQKITNEFEVLMASQHMLFDKLLADDSLLIIKEAEIQYSKLLNQFISNCTEISKI